MFNQPIGKVILPPSLTHIAFGEMFNQPINKVIFPPSLTHLDFKWKFDHSLDNLPNTITHLSIDNLKKPLDNLPPSLKKLTLYNT
jgi:hypothetical protein